MDASAEEGDVSRFIFILIFNDLAADYSLMLASYLCMSCDYSYDSYEGWKFTRIDDFMIEMLNVHNLNCNRIPYPAFL